MMKKIPTIRDVAQRSNYSLSTVSLVLNNKPNVSETARREVRTIIDELGYHPRRNARGLASHHSGNIGFIVTDDHFSRAEPFYTKIFLGTEFEARKHNYYILLTTVSRSFRTSEIPRFLLEHNADGVIVAGEIGNGWIEYMMEQRLPVVLIDYALSRRPVSAVLIDNEAGARLAVDHLYNNGHTRIGFIAGNMSHPSIRSRYEGYCETMMRHGLLVRRDLVCTDAETTAQADGYRAAQRLFTVPAPPTAVFAANDAMAIGCMQFMKEHGVTVGEQTAVIGFDNIEAGLHVAPRLSTIGVPCEELGSNAVRRMAEMIRDKTSVVTTTVVPVELIVRESCGSNRQAASVGALS
ncbi:MAG TPA: LacI family DNA-binding transcriptional regulator [Bacteroidota bacterium]|nr:LacI family DNA-binding transcriptional regulator [Bacteroidota bacterium]